MNIRTVVFLLTLHPLIVCCVPHKLGNIDNTVKNNTSSMMASAPTKTVIIQPTPSVPKSVSSDCGVKPYPVRVSEPALIESSVIVSTLAGRYGNEYERFWHPLGLGVDNSGNIYVADTEAGFAKVKFVTPSGKVSIPAFNWHVTTPETGPIDRFSRPNDVAIDNKGTIYVSEVAVNPTTYRILKITSNGEISTFAGGEARDHKESPIGAPFGLAIDRNGDLYVADAYSDRILKIKQNGAISTLAGSTEQGCADGPGYAAKFYHPYDLALDSNGNVFVTDTENNRIRKITPSGEVSTFAGSGVLGYLDGNASIAQFNQPYGIAIDSHDNVYVADDFNNRIRKITPGGQVSTLAGSGPFGAAEGFGWADGSGETAQFSEPFGIAVDNQDNIYCG